MIKTKIFPP